MLEAGFEPASLMMGRGVMAARPASAREPATSRSATLLQVVEVKAKSTASTPSSRDSSALGVDYEVILKPPCILIFVWRITNEVYSVVSE